MTIKESLAGEMLAGISVLVIGGPREKFTSDEFDTMKRFVDRGGRILLLMSEGGEEQMNTNVNYFLEDFGVTVNTDAVVRTVFDGRHFHPKEVVIAHGVLNREINRAAGKAIPGHRTADSGAHDESSTAGARATGHVSFMYPFGATLAVQKPSVPVLSSGNVSFPLNRPVCAFFQGRAAGMGRPPVGTLTQPQAAGRLVVTGSVHMFSDEYLEQEENSKVLEVILRWLTTDEVHLNAIDAEDPEVSDYHFLPDTVSLSETVRCCLQEGDDVPRDFTKLFEPTLSSLNTSVLPLALEAFELLRTPHEPLTLIRPEFETPLPPLQPAVIPPTFKVQKSGQPFGCVCRLSVCLYLCDALCVFVCGATVCRSISALRAHSCVPRSFRRPLWTSLTLMNISRRSACDWRS
jgi:intraflagellar transport protein 52